MQRHRRFACTGAAGMVDVALTAEPKQYTIGASRVRDRKVVGGFCDVSQWR